jgi:hypothetical protein
MSISAQPKIRPIFNIGYAATNVKVIARKGIVDGQRLESWWNFCTQGGGGTF